MRWILFALATLPALALDLTKAAIVAPASLTAREKRAVRLLGDEIAKRSQIRLPIAASASGPAIEIRRAARGPAEGYTIRTEQSRVIIEGNDERGVLFGIGRLLRNLDLTPGRIDLPRALNLTTAPETKLRGHQLGYRPKTNSYDGWTIAQWEQYISDLAIFGINAIELIPPRSDDDDQSPHFPQPKMETMIAMSRIADELGLDLWIWYPALDADYGKPEFVEFALKEWAEVFRQLPRIDALFVPGGDPGHTHPRHLMPLLEKQTASLRKFHPKAQMWMAPQGFNEEWFAEFLQIMKTGPAWLHGIVHGPQLRMNIGELRKMIPARYPLRNYPDITHSLRCQFPVLDWDTAYAMTLNREPINPRPQDMRRMFDIAKDHTVGYITYSEGCNDDVNKAVWSALGWDSKADLHETLREYSRYFIGAPFAESFAQGLFALERNWRGRLASNDGVYTTLQQFDAMDREASPAVLANWRFQMAQYRVHYDAYVRARLIHETSLEQQALDRLREASSIGSLVAMNEAERILDSAVTARPAPHWRARTFELAEALFQSVRMQLSVPYYRAIAVGRGANLDLIDAPLNNRMWLRDNFARIRQEAAEPARLTEIAALVNWTNPGPGGFYDDLGVTVAQPHLVRQPSASDPESRRTPLNGFASTGDTRTWRYSWLNHAEGLFDAPVEMQYDGLNPSARYRVRVVYAGENNNTEVLLSAEGRPVHAAMRKPFPPRPIEFDIPAEATADGRLRLKWERAPGIGGAGRGLQIAEVWLTPVR
jgi:hypothetical protein